MKPPPDGGSFWPDAIQEMTLLAAGVHEVTFADSLDVEKRRNTLTMTRADWNAIKNRVTITVGVWRG